PRRSTVCREMLIALLQSRFSSHFSSYFVFSCHPFHRSLHSFPTRRSSDLGRQRARTIFGERAPARMQHIDDVAWRRRRPLGHDRSEEHTSELQSPDHLVCRLLLEKKNL